MRLPIRRSMTQSFRVVCLIAALALATSAVRAQQIPFEDVVRNLRNPDPKVRMSSLQLLREAKYFEAVKPIAPLVNDAVEEIQLEALATELSFYLVEDAPAKRKVGLVVEVRSKSVAAQLFEQGPLVAWPRPVPPELIDALLKALDDEGGRVRSEAAYTLGIIGQPPLSADESNRVIKALDHYDPAIRTAAARVIGRLQVKSACETLIKTINDSNEQVRFASMRALGDLKEESAVTALTEQFKYYDKGQGAWAALDALARIAHPSSVRLFKSRLNDKDELIRRAAAEGLARTGDASELSTLQAGASTDSSPMTRAAMTFAMEKLGQNYLTRLVDFLNSSRLVPQVQGYLRELGPAIVPALAPRLQEPDADVRAQVAEALGVLGDESTVAVLDPLTKDRDRNVAAAATQAIDRIKMTRAMPPRSPAG
jgi:HEAT repeat protein